MDRLEMHLRRKRVKHGKNQKQSRFVQLPHWIMASNAWMRLTPVQRCVWLEAARLYNGANNGRLALPARLIGDRLRVTHTTVCKVW
jgi:hypothetical protein